MGRLRAIAACSKAVFSSTGTVVWRGVPETFDSENSGLTRKNPANKRITSIVGRVNWLTFIDRDGVSEASTEIALLPQLLKIAAFARFSKEITRYD